MDDFLTLLEGDAVENLCTLETGSVQCVVTSPPFWGLRDYGHNEQLGLEKTPDEYVSKLVEVFREVRRVLRKDGTLWLNLGDSYAGSGKGSNPDGTPHPSTLDSKSGTNRGCVNGLHFSQKASDIGLKPKDLCGIPWRVAFALQADGWWLRSDIIWAKPNPMPESVTDRPTKSHEYLFLLTKSANYFYDAEAIKEKSVTEPHAAGYTSGDEYAIGPMSRNGHSQREGDQSRVWGKTKSFDSSQGGGGTSFVGHSGNMKANGEPIFTGARNKRSVWTVTTSPYPDAHFATYPPDLIKPCIMAGSRVGDIVLDPFGGSGTTGMVALELGRKAVLIELNPEYCKLIEKRCTVTLGLSLTA